MGKQDLVRQWVRKHSWGLAMLVGLLIVSTWTVKHFKRPGQMTVIESQAMDMTAMKPPVGSVPVATEFVGMGEFSAKVRYTGSVAPYTEQNIYPRVDGWLTGLKVYNGDRVRAGQLLAVLDSPDIQNKLSEATYGHIAALKEVPVSQSNLARMRAERNAARGEIRSAEGEIAGARARVVSAQKELKSAQASLNYWRAEFRRQENLLKAGAVSRQEYDSEQAQLIAAEAEVENKQANIEAAQAELSSKQAQVQVARDRAAAADAALSAASGEVSQKGSMANMAGARRATAATFNQYRMIRAPFDGVVTKRYLSPGVLVSPGTAILNIAQIDTVRLQANVAEQDLANIRIGAEVVAHVSKGRTIRAVVSSISPSADPTSRTSIVEAIVDNADHSLVPGDFVSMEISTSSDPSVITVPSSALISKDGRDAVWITRCTKGGKTVYYCTMHPEVVSDKPGLCPKCKMALEKKQANTGKVAHLVYVTIGETDGNRMKIVSGLVPGDEIIYKGHRYLREGDAVAIANWGADGLEQLPSPPSGAESDDMKNMPGM
ncbi:MAG: efflux RND transporter periplasmic adaptor subunit [Armatimonadota bacterium]